MLWNSTKIPKYFSTKVPQGLLEDWKVISVLFSYLRFVPLVKVMRFMEMLHGFSLIFSPKTPVAHSSM